MSVTSWLASFAVFLLGALHLVLWLSLKQRFHLALAGAWLFNILYILLEHLSLRGDVPNVFPAAAGATVLTLFVYANSFLSPRTRKETLFLSWAVAVAFITLALTDLPDQLRLFPLALVSMLVYGSLGRNLLSLNRRQFGRIFRPGLLKPSSPNEPEGELDRLESQETGSLPIEPPSGKRAELHRVPKFLADRELIGMNEAAVRKSETGKKLAGGFYLAFAVLQLFYPFKQDILAALPALWRGLFVAGMILKTGTGVGFVVLFQAYQLAREAQLRRSETIEGLAVIMAAVQHDMAQPLSAVGHLIAVMRLLAGDLRSDFGSKLNGYANQLDATRKRIAAVMDLVVAMRQTPEEFSASSSSSLCSLDVVLRKSVKTAKEIQKHLSPVIRTDHWRTSLSVYGSEQRLVQVITNLLNNSIEAKAATSPGQTPVVEVSSTVDAEQGEILILVEDDGGGVPSDIYPFIKKPFVSSKDPESKPNSGVGLYIADRLVLLHRGRLEIENEVGVGCRVTVALPLPQSAKERKT